MDRCQEALRIGLAILDLVDRSADRYILIRQGKNEDTGIIEWRVSFKTTQIYGDKISRDTKSLAGCLERALKLAIQFLPKSGM